MTVQILKISTDLCCGSHVGGQENAQQPIFPHIYNIIENSPTSFARNCVFVGPNDFTFGTETNLMVFLAISKFGTSRSQFA